MAPGWTGSAEAYAGSFARLCAGTVPEILARLGPAVGGPLLDVGTGPGTVAAAARRQGCSVIGLDPEHSMIALARERHPQIPFALGALPRLPCADASVGAVTANFVVNHTPDPRAAVRELCRVVRSGGPVVATIWSAEAVALGRLWDDVQQRARVAPPAGSRLPPELDFERTPAGFAAILTEAGLVGVDCRPVRWTFRINPADLWLPVEAGVAVIGQTYRSQDASGRRRMRAAYEEVARAASVDGMLSLPSVALVGSGRRPP